jgi:ABC-type amino acid transport system permease subunit
MSQENVEIIKAAIAAVNRGNWDAALSYAAPDLVTASRTTASDRPPPDD